MIHQLHVLIVAVLAVQQTSIHILGLEWEQLETPSKEHLNLRSTLFYITIYIIYIFVNKECTRVFSIFFGEFFNRIAILKNLYKMQE